MLTNAFVELIVKSVSAGRLLFALGLLVGAGMLVVGCESDLARRISKYERMNDDAAAKQLLQQTVRRNPENAEAHFLLGKIYMQEGSYEKGVAAFEKSQSASMRYEEKIAFLEEKHAREEFQEGREALEAEAYGRAETAFRAVLTIQPSNASAAKAVGQSLAEADRPDDARTAYREALEMSPEDVEILNNLSALAVQAEDYSTAIKYARRALEQSNPPPAVRRRLAYALVETGQFSKASQRFEEALQQEPTPQLRRDYAFLLYNQEAYQEALPALRQLSSTTDSLKVLRALGETYGALERPADAAEVYEQILERRPNDMQALQRVIIAYEQSGKEEAAQDYRDRLQRVRTEAER